MHSLRTKVAAAVFKPLKLKSKPGRSVIGRGNLKRPATPDSAIFDNAGPPG